MYLIDSSRCLLCETHSVYQKLKKYIREKSTSTEQLMNQYTFYNPYCEAYFHKISNPALFLNLFNVMFAETL